MISMLGDVGGGSDPLLPRLQEMIEVVTRQNATIAGAADRARYCPGRAGCRLRRARCGTDGDREAAAADPAAAAWAVRPALGEARPRPAPARPGGPRAGRGRRRGGAGSCRQE